MVLLGVILVLLAAAAGVVLVAGTAQLTDSVQIDVLGGTLSIPPLTLLITGMVVISVFWLGWALLRGGLRRSKRRRVEAKEAAAAAEAERVEEQQRMQDEFAAREQALTEERRRREEAESLVADQRQRLRLGRRLGLRRHHAHDRLGEPTRRSSPAPTPARSTATARSDRPLAHGRLDHRACRRQQVCVIARGGRRAGVPSSALADRAVARAVVAPTTDPAGPGWPPRPAGQPPTPWPRCSTAH